MFSSIVSRVVTGVSLLGVVGGAVLTPTPAKAWWVREGYVAPVFVPRPVVVARPVYVAPPVIVARPARFWVRPHYNQFGYFVPGH